MLKNLAPAVCHTPESIKLPGDSTNLFPGICQIPPNTLPGFFPAPCTFGKFLPAGDNLLNVDLPGHH